MDLNLQHTNSSQCTKVQWSILPIPILHSKKGLLRIRTNSLDNVYLSKQTLMTTPTKRLQWYRRKSIPDPDRNLILKHPKKSSTKEYCKVDSTNNIKNILAHQFISIKAQFHSVFSYLCQCIGLTILIVHRCSSNSFVYSID